jgi:hypothetical protein
MRKLRVRRLAPVTALCATLSLGACVMDDAGPDTETIGETSSELWWDPAPDPDSVDRGRDIWFNETFGGEQFFAYLASPAAGHQQIVIGFENVLQTPRSQRFDVWGVINDPDCEANPNGGYDICDDPTATGVIGMRRGIGGLIGAACASCHAGFDPLNPPANPNEPTWDNIHATIGNMHLDLAAVFQVNLPANDPRRQMFDAWPLGTVDTTALFNDGIMNPGTITAFWEHDDRPKFDVHRTLYEGTPNEVTESGTFLNNGQGGEDSFGGGLAAARVYANIGACFGGCVAPAAATQTEIDIATCKAVCEPLGQWPSDQDLEDLTTFLGTFDAPQYPGWPTNWLAYAVGGLTFQANCEHCHDNNSSLRATQVFTDDTVTLFVDDLNPDPQANLSDPAYWASNTTNNCRALTTNWEPGQIWGQFTSDEYQARAAMGDKGYRTMPLAGVWATSPLTHGNNIGVLADADATPAERAAAFRTSMLELMSANRTPIINVLTEPVYLPDGQGGYTVVPAGTPHHYVYSAGKCVDLVQNRGHYFGADLPSWKKEALIYFLRYQ